MNTFNYNYKTTLPQEANAPSVTIDGALFLEYIVSFYVKRDDGLLLIKKVSCKTGETVEANSHQWFDLWYITIHNNGVLVSEDTFNPKNKTIFIKMDAYALGDNIAWIPYVEEFRVKHECNVICSTFYNDLFKKIYPNIIFAPINLNLENVYAQYYIGASNKTDSKESPVLVDSTRLQYVASKTLGLNDIEIRPKIENNFNRVVKKNYVCISEYASHNKKMWKCENGWQKIVDFINSIGYEVLVISKEQTNLNGVINLTGDFSLLDRAKMILDSKLFIGVSSGLSWLAWSVDTPCILISDVTPLEHEFKYNTIRLSANSELLTIDYDVDNHTDIETVINAIKSKLIVNI